MNPAAQEAEAYRALDFLRRAGYRRCDIAACNCGSWHGGHAEDRLAEIKAALDDTGAPQCGGILVDRIKALRAAMLLAELDTATYLRAEADRLRQGTSDITTAAWMAAYQQGAEDAWMPSKPRLTGATAWLYRSVMAFSPRRSKLWRSARSPGLHGGSAPAACACSLRR